MQAGVAEAVAATAQKRRVAEEAVATQAHQGQAAAERLCGRQAMGEMQRVVAAEGLVGRHMGSCRGEEVKGRVGRGDAQSAQRPRQQRRQPG